MDEGNEIKTIGKILGAASANIGAVIIGIDPSTEVAAQCIEGRSVGKYLVFHSTTTVDSRYEGMRRAFGDNNEIFRKPWLNDERWLSTDDYDKLVKTAYAKSRQGYRLNRHLKEPLPFHVIRWGWDAYDHRVATLYIVISLFPMLGIALARWMLGLNGVTDILYALSFLLISTFDGWLLDVMREVCYVEVRQDDVSEALHWKWEDLRNSDEALEGLAKLPAEALNELARGMVRKQGRDVLLIPVLGLRTTLKDRWASWACILTDLRKVVMAFSFFQLDDSHLIWGFLYGFAAAVQACCQREVAEQYIKTVTENTDDIIWFRRLPEYESTYPSSMASISLDSNDRKYLSVSII